MISSATLLAEFLVGAFLFVVVLFFFLRDGRAMWAWVVARQPHAPGHIETAPEARARRPSGREHGHETVIVCGASLVLRRAEAQQTSPSDASSKGPT